MISSRDQRRIYLLPGKPDQSRNPGLQDISKMVKQDQQSLPDVPTNPDRSCTYLVLRAHRISEVYRYRHNPSCQGMVPHGALVWTNTRRSTGPGGGGKIKMTLESAEPKGKSLRWKMLKPMLGLARGVLFKASCQGGPINHPNA